MSTIETASTVFGIPVRRFGNFDTEQGKYVHILRMKINEIQRGFQKEGEMFYNKSAFKEFMIKNRIKSPQTYGYMTNMTQWDDFWSKQKDLKEFVFKPNHLSQGKFIHVMKRIDDKLVEHNGAVHDEPYFKSVAQTIMNGRHVYKGIMLEETVHSHPDLKKWYGVEEGIADMRLYALYDKILYGKLRLPAKRSGYYSNTGRDAPAFHINVDGIVDNSYMMDNTITIHPDTNKNFKGEKVPFWDKFYQTGLVVAKLFKIPFHSIDLTIDETGEATVIESEKIPFLGHYTVKGAVEMLNLIKKYGG